MPSLGQLLRRLRRHAVPGRAQPAAVPVDRREEMEKELEPVFALLEPIAAATRARMNLAGRDADRVLADARRRSRQAADDARSRVATEAAAALARELARLEREADRSAARAEAECQAIRAVKESRVGALSEKMVDFALALPSGSGRPREIGP